MDRPERGVAVLHALDEHANADEIEDVVELPALHDHLLVDAPVVLRTTRDVSRDAQLPEPLLDLLEHLGEVDVALGRAGGDHLLDLRVALRVQGRERQVLQLPLHVLDAEAVGQRRVHVERLLRGAPLLPLGHRRDRAHVVEPVGQLDEQDADVLGHRHEHLAERGGLLRLLRVELEPVELGDPVHDGGDVRPELLLEVLVGDGGVLDGVVQERGHDRDVVETEIGEDHRHPERMRDVRLPGSAHLVGVGDPGDLEGLLDHRGVGLPVPVAVGGDERRDLDVDVVPAPGQDRAPVGSYLNPGLGVTHESRVLGGPERGARSLRRRQ